MISHSSSKRLLTVLYTVAIPRAGKILRPAFKDPERLRGGRMLGRQAVVYVAVSCCDP